MGIHLKSILRQPVRTLLLLLLIGLISFAFVARAVEYIVVSREIERLGGYYRSIGSLEAADSDAAPMANAMALVAGSPFVSAADPRRYVSGILPEGQMSADRYAITSDWTGGPARGVFITDVMAYGELVELNYSDSTGWWHLGLKVDEILEGRPENAAVGEVLSLTILPATVPEGVDPVAGMVKGGRYFIRACADMGFSLAERGEDRRVAHLRMKPILEAGGPWFLPVAAGARIDLDSPELAPLKADLAVLRQNIRTLQVIGTRDMASVPQFQTAAREYEITSGRGITPEDGAGAHPVCVLSEGYAAHAGLGIGDTLTLTLRDSQGPYGYISTLTEDWENWQSLPTQEIELEIVGTFDRQQRVGTYYYYQVHEVYIPLSVMPEGFGREGSDDINSGSFSFVLDSTENQPAFLASLRLPLAALGYEIRFVEHHADNFWLSARPMVRASGLNAAVFTLVLALTLVLCAFLYLRGRRRDFAIQRALGRPSRRAIPEMLAPMAAIALLGILGGGALAWRYALARAEETLTALSGPQDMAASAALSPLWLAGLCGGVLALLLMVLLAGIALTVGRPVLELLQNGAARPAGDKAALEAAMAGQVIEALSSGMTAEPAATATLPARQSVRGAARYVLRHARRSLARSSLCIVTALSFVLALGWMSAALRGSMAEVDRLYDTTAIRAEFVPAVRGDQGGGMVVRPQVCEAILETGIIEDYYFQGTLFLRAMAPAAPPEGQIEAYPFDKSKLTGRPSLTYYVDDVGDFLAHLGVQTDAPRRYLDGWDDGFLAGDHAGRPLTPLLVSETFLQETGFALGDTVFLTSFTVPIGARALVTDPDMYTCVGYEIIGALEGDSGFFLAPRACLGRLPPSYQVYSAAEFAIDPLRNRDIPAIREALMLDVPWTAFKVSVRLEIFDEELRQAVAPLESNIALMEVLYPVTLAVSVLIGAGLALLLTLQSAREAAIMRVLGITRLWVRAQLTAEQLVLCLIGLALGLLGLIALAAQSGAEPLVCAALYLAGTAAGATAAAVTVSNHAPLELLQVKE